MIIKRSICRSRHFSVRGELREWILIDLEFGVARLKAPEGSLVPELVGDLASTPEATTKPLRLLVGGHDLPLPLGHIASSLLLGLLSLLSGQVDELADSCSLSYLLSSLLLPSC
ncbi:hypothetical protein B296_00040314 [Ensete ventricosum]|uniref:Uncharacterized protein n=1 Tax=Ensete ventricosum TaxID=4639 RepID=A0A426X982_ENSVE|nr:hypothetical protein B296_00040314 [Ensete ventricosum]